jgi:hypothetical protein
MFNLLLELTIAVVLVCAIAVVFAVSLPLAR